MQTSPVSDDYIAILRKSNCRNIGFSVLWAKMLLHRLNIHYSLVPILLSFQIILDTLFFSIGKPFSSRGLRHGLSKLIGLDLHSSPIGVSTALKTHRLQAVIEPAGNFAIRLANSSTNGPISSGSKARLIVP